MKTWPRISLLLCLFTRLACAVHAQPMRKPLKCPQAGTRCLSLRDSPQRHWTQHSSRSIWSFGEYPARLSLTSEFACIFSSTQTRIRVPDEKSMSNWWQKLHRQIWLEFWSSTASSLQGHTWKIFTGKCFECWHYMFMHSHAAWRWQTLSIMRKNSRTKMWSRRQGLLLKMTRSVTLQSVTPILKLPLRMRGRNQMNERARGWCFARGREFFTSIFYRNSGFAARICTGVGKLVSVWIACVGFLLQVCSMSVGLCLMRQLRTCVHSPPTAAVAAQEPTDDPRSYLGPKSEGVRRAWIGQTRIFSFGRMFMILLTFFLQFSPVTGVRVAASPIGAAEAAHVHFHQAAQGGAAKHYGYPHTVHGAANSRAGKRSFRRACARAQSSQQGGTWYRGRWLTTSDLRAVPLRRISQASGHSRSRTTPRGSAARAVSCGASGTRLHVLTWNCGGLSTGLLDELLLYLQERAPHINIICLQDTGNTKANG